MATNNELMEDVFDEDIDEEEVVVEERKGLIAKAKDFGENHPKVTKVIKTAGTVLGGVLIGLAVGKATGHSDDYDEEDDILQDVEFQALEEVCSEE